MKVLMFAHNGSLNRGCEAIVRSSTQIIKSQIKDSYIELASGRPKTDEILKKVDYIFDASGRELNPNFIQKLRMYMELKINKTEHYALSIIYKSIIDRINDVDVCLSIGGDNYCYGEQQWLYTIDKNIKKRGKKLVLWGCSIGEEDLSERKLEDLKTFDLILARETLTYDVLKKNGITTVKLCADPAFTMEKEELPLPNGWKVDDTIGLNFSPLVLKRNPDSKKAISELIEYILENTTSTIALTPHVIESGNDDYELLKEYFDAYMHTGRVILLPDDLNAIQYKGYISRMRFFIGARTHATIAAYSTCVPTMVLGYSVKSRGIAKDLFGEEKLVLGVNDLSKSDILINNFNHMLKEEHEIKECLKNKIPEMKNYSYKMAQYIQELMSEN